MTPEEARAIIEPLKRDILALYEESKSVTEATDRDWARLIELKARYRDYLTALIDDPVPVKPFLSGDKVADFVMEKWDELRKESE